MTGYPHPDCADMDCETCPERDTCPDYRPNGPRIIRASSTKHPLVVYIAHPMSGYPAEYLHNCGRMLYEWSEVNSMGFVGVCPATDMLLGLAIATMGQNAPTVDDYRRWSMAILERCDVLYVSGTHHEDGRPSDGVTAEIARAEWLNMPIVWSIEELAAMRGTEP